MKPASSNSTRMSCYSMIVFPPTEDFYAVMRRLHHTVPHMRIIVISGRLHARYLQTVFGAGASGFIYREDRLEESLLAGIETVYLGHFFMSPRASGLSINGRTIDNTLQLNHSDLEVLRLIARD